MRTSSWLLITALLAGAGCDRPLVDESTEAASTKAIIYGRVFFNDRRDHGLFSTRRTPSGELGERCGVDGVFDDGAACPANWLAARYMVVDVIERDKLYTTGTCATQDIIATATVAFDGTFSTSFVPRDACATDDPDPPAYQLRVRTRFCNDDYCFSVDRDDGEPYTWDVPGATYGSPLVVTAGQTYDVGDVTFGASDAGFTPTDTVQAANLYASLVDAVITIHRDGGVPFFQDEFGELELIFPSDETTKSVTKSASEIHFDDVSGWIEGQNPVHEYGHALMLRAWDGDYGWDAVGLPWDMDTYLEPRHAFKEAWATFVTRAVLTETYGCDKPHFDDNDSDSTPLPGGLGQGVHWAQNVTKLLCDWYDSRDDDDPILPGPGDHFAAADFYSVWSNLRDMYVYDSVYGGQYENGLAICDWVHYYLDVRKGPSQVGQASHDDYVDLVSDLIYNNGIQCDLPAP